MKIGIITIVKVDNYGAELQAFALQKELKSLGVQSEIIDYIYYKNWRFKDSFKSLPINPMNNKKKVMYWIKYRFISYLAEIVFPLFDKFVKRRIENFKRFHSENTTFSKSIYSIEDLYKSQFNYDIYMVGSDQVWNPCASSTIAPYFLTFAPHSAKKVSYASSFGVAELEPKLHNIYKKLINNLDVISVREPSGIDIIKELTGKTAKVTCDPTFLITKKEWEYYIKEYPNMPLRYIIIYQISKSDNLIDLANKISKEKNIPIYRICKRAFGVSKNKNIINILDAGPAEFLYLFKNAEYVITNSFHGTAFSIILEIPFYTIISNKKDNNQRMVSLLEMLGLKNRIITENYNIQKQDVQYIDFKIIKEQINDYRNESISYLLDCLKSDKS
jgi:hypothetical protein